MTETKRLQRFDGCTNAIAFHEPVFIVYARELSEIEEKLAEYEKKANFLLALEIAGVDNWSGYSIAFEVAEEHGLEIE